MTKQVIIIAIILTAVGLGALASFLIITELSAPQESREVDEHHHSSNTTTHTFSKPNPAPEFTLISQDNETFRLKDLRGKVVLITFIYTRCPDVCPILTDKFKRIQDELGEKFGKTVFMISITIDPEYDRPAVLRQYAERFGADLSGWAFLTGDKEDITEVAKSYGIYFKEESPGLFTHTVLTFLVNEDGQIVKVYAGAYYSVNEVLHDINELLES